MKKSFFQVDRKLTDAEWELLKIWKKENPSCAWKCGDIRKDGMRFRVYSRTHRNGERWITEEIFEKERVLNLVVCRQHRIKDKEAYNKKNRERYQRNIEKRRERNRIKARERYKADPDKVREISASYSNKNPDKVKEQHKRSRKKNIDKVSSRLAKRRGAILNVKTAEEKQKIARVYQWRDMLNKIHGKIVFHVDHIVPISRGGTHSFSNIRVTTATYNLKKNAQIV
jgi:5-methylcytosine-specific restriction endonuclease McrA